MDVWLPLLSAFGGAIFGSVASVVTVIIQSRKEEARHMREMAVQLALADQSRHLEEARARSPGVQTPILPLSGYVAHYLHALNLARKGSLTAEDLRALKDEGEKVAEAIE